MGTRLTDIFPDGMLCANEGGKTVISNCSKADAGIAEEKDYPLYLSMCKHCYHQFAGKMKGAQHCHRCQEMMALKAENALQAQQIVHLTEEINRLKKALRVADEAVNIATDRGVY